MKLYLSSYKLGNGVEKLKEMMSSNKKLGYIPNALDFSGADPVRKEQGITKEMDELRALGLDVDLMDLKHYFGRSGELRKKIEKLGGIFVRGGNTFVLRQAMKINGLDEILKELSRKDFVYSGYSAGVCVLAPDLSSIKDMDDPNDTPYKEIKKSIFEGLGILNYMIIPHYRSNHPESPGAEKEVEYCKKNNIPHKPLSDGEVIIVE